MVAAADGHLLLLHCCRSGANSLPTREAAQLYLKTASRRYAPMLNVMTITTYVVQTPASWAGWRLDVLVEKFPHAKKNRPHQVGIAIGDCFLYWIVGVKPWGPTVQLSAHAVLRPVTLALHLLCRLCRREEQLYISSVRRDAAKCRANRASTRDLCASSPLLIMSQRKA